LVEAMERVLRTRLDGRDRRDLAADILLLTAVVNYLARAGESLAAADFAERAYRALLRPLPAPLRQPVSALLRMLTGPALDAADLVVSEPAAHRPSGLRAWWKQLRNWLRGQPTWAGYLGFALAYGVAWLTGQAAFVAVLGLAPIGMALLFV